MIKLTRDNVDALYEHNQKKFIPLCRRLLFDYNLGNYLEVNDLLNSAYVKIVTSKKDSFENEDHFRAYFYISIKTSLIDTITRFGLKKQVEFNPEYHQFSGNTINGSFEDDYLKATLGELYQFQSEETNVAIIKRSINEIKNPVQKKLINLLSYSLDYDCISKMTGIKKGSNLRVKMFQARKSLFTNLQKNGMMAGVSYSDTKCAHIKSTNCSTSELDRMKLNRTQYLFSNYPIDDSFENKVLFILTRISPIDKKKLVALIALNEEGKTIEYIRTYTNLVLDKLHKKGEIHIEGKSTVYIN